MQTAKAKIGAAFWQMDMADKLALRGEHDHPILILPASPATPEISVRVAPDSVWNAELCVCEQTFLSEMSPTVDHVKYVDTGRLRAALDDVKQRLVG